MNRKDWILVFGFYAFVFFVSNLSADAPSRASRSDVDFVPYSSTQVTTQVQNVQVTTGVTRIDAVSIDSAGINSQLFLYDSNISSGNCPGSNTCGNSTVTIAGTGSRGINTTSLRDVRIEVETSTRGLVITSTCTACAIQWSEPAFRLIYQRVR